jgi:deazaflavin-dependent oxidoreductase (nitroreductase family)
MNAVHRAVQLVTFGKLGWRTSSMPVLELTTVGRRSGQSRTVLLTSPMQEGSTYVVVASRGGDDTHPAWFLNLRDDPNVQVATGSGPKQRMRARIADPEERARVWPTITAGHENYAEYQTKTAREIPVVFLEPVS